MPRAKPIGVAALAIGLLAVPGRSNACTVSAEAVAFGSYNSLSAANDDGVGTIRANCSPGTGEISISIGSGSSGSFSRSMANGGTRLNYNLYTDSARISVWGDGSSGTSTVTLPRGSVSGGRRYYERTVYGRIPAAQKVRAGNYGDTLVVTVSY